MPAFTSAGVADPFTGTSVGLCGSVEHLTEMMVTCVGGSRYVPGLGGGGGGKGRNPFTGS